MRSREGLLSRRRRSHDQVSARHGSVYCSETRTTRLFVYLYCIHSSSINQTISVSHPESRSKTILYIYVVNPSEK